ncbi:uncharacterized protein BDW70DRAFT_145870, partial [Aspergillus foveolatus]|uniref:uncharacterized protein n=1 Tax=Aspergillus foveolatus TaxID=210207 RepID=UPI003CCCC151
SLNTLLHHIPHMPVSYSHYVPIILLVCPSYCRYDPSPLRALASYCQYDSSEPSFFRYCHTLAAAQLVDWLTSFSHF